jgi:hypothetical protein
VSISVLLATANAGGEGAAGGDTVVVAVVYVAEYGLHPPAFSTSSQKLYAVPGLSNVTLSAVPGTGTAVRCVAKFGSVFVAKLYDTR